MDEAEITRVLKSWAKEDEAYKEELLQRCLSVLGQEGYSELDDSALDMLAAAGSPYFRTDIPPALSDS